VVVVAAPSARLPAEQPAVAAPATRPEKSALLIGIGSYDHAASEIKVPVGTPRTGRYAGGLRFNSLKGPAHDIDSMRELLTSEKFGFPNDDRHIHVLRDAAATRDGMLKAMEKYLVTDPRPGDTVVLYISSHGSLRANPKGHGPLYDLDGTATAVENTIVPYDWYLGKDDIFSRDLRHLFNLAADRGIHVTAIFDSCHSGSIARGAESTGLVAKDFVYDPRPMPDDPYPAEAAGTPPERRAVNPVLVLSAAQKDQLAMDLGDADPPHGLFTAALIETLNALPADRPAGDVFKRLQVAMELAPDAVNQQPALDTSSARIAEPLFGGSAGSGPLTAAVVAKDRNGVVLDIGVSADIGPGSEFTAVTERNGLRPVLQITQSQELARSRAKVIAPAGAGVEAKDIVQLSKWVPAPHAPLYFYLATAAPTTAQLQEARHAVQASQLKLVADPSADLWTHHLSWDGTQWILRAHASTIGGDPVLQEKPLVLGHQLTAAALKNIPSSGTVWFDAPFPSDAAAGILRPVGPGDPPRAAQLTPDRNVASYVLAGTLADDEIRYAWFKRSELDAEMQTPKNFGAGCSPNSAFPLRTDWTSLGGTSRPEDALTKSATQLAKLSGWLNLGTSPGVQSDFPYTLKLRRVNDTQDTDDGGRTFPGSYELRLVKHTEDKVSPRWIYVMAIDCQGKSALLWPTESAPPAQFPSLAGQFDDILLPDSEFDVVEPAGTDTYVLLTTETALQNYRALDFEGVVSSAAKGARGAATSPLDELLEATSAGVRGAAHKATPTTWSVQKIQVLSQPSQAP
jgi:hypothetical protein